MAIAFSLKDSHLITTSVVTILNKILTRVLLKTLFPKGDGLYAELSTDIHNFHIFCLFVMIFCTESGNGCL